MSEEEGKKMKPYVQVEATDGSTYLLNENGDFLGNKEPEGPIESIILETYLGRLAPYFVEESGVNITEEDRAKTKEWTDTLTDFVELAKGKADQQGLEASYFLDFEPIQDGKYRKHDDRMGVVTSRLGLFASLTGEYADQATQDATIRITFEDPHQWRNINPTQAQEIGRIAYKIAELLEVRVKEPV